MPVLAKVLCGQQIFLMGGFLRFGGSEQCLGIYLSFIFPVALFVLAYVVHTHTLIGAYIIVIGNSEENAKLGGINIDRVKIGIFMFSGLCCGLAGIMLSTRMSFMQPGLDGNGLLLDSIPAIIIIGGTLILGGRGTIGVVILVALGVNWVLWQSRQAEAH